MRYFLISRKVIVNNSISFEECNCFSGINFPSLKLIKEKTVSSYEEKTGEKVKNVSGILILNLFEFANERDCNDYLGIENEPIEKEMD